MTNKTAKRIRESCAIATSLSTVVAAIALMAACVGIYHSGDQPFSREAVAAAFSPIAVWVYACLFFVILGFVLDLMLPADSKKTAPGKDLVHLLKRQQSKADLSAADEDLRSAIAAEQKSRRLHRRVTAALLTIGSAVFLCYALNGGNFHQSEINTSMIRAMYVLTPCMGIPCCYAIFTAYRNASSMEKEIGLLKQCPRSSAPAAEPTAPDNKASLLRNGLILAGIALLVYGFCTGGTADVLTKAVNICTECIGLG